MGFCKEQEKLLLYCKIERGNRRIKDAAKIVAADHIVVAMKLWKHSGAKGLACLFSYLFTTNKMG